jgi:hypothetical protein
MSITRRLSFFLVILFGLQQAVIGADHDHAMSQEQVSAILQDFSDIVKNGELKKLSVLINKYPLLVGTYEDIQNKQKEFETAIAEGNKKSAELLKKRYGFIRKTQQKKRISQRLSRDMKNKNKIEKNPALLQNAFPEALWGPKEQEEITRVKDIAIASGFTKLADALSSIHAWYKRDKVAIRAQTRYERDEWRSARLAWRYKNDMM